MKDLQQHMHHKAKLCVRLGSVCSNAEEILQNAALKLSFEYEVTNAQTFMVTLTDHSKRPELFSLLAAAKLPVIEFREERPDLDQLFRSLVEETTA